MQQKVITQGDSIAAAFGHEPTGIVKVISWMVRATFLDTRVASAAANDVNGNLAAILALLITYLPGLVFTSLLTALFTMRLGALLALFTGLAVIAVSLLVALLVMSALSVKILQVKLPAAVLLRTLAYAQTALIVGAIPLLGGFIGPVARIWSIAASAVAVREAASASAEKATIFVVIGVVIQVTLGMALSVLATRAGLM